MTHYALVISIMTAFIGIALTFPARAGQPVITKRGTIECDLVEATPLVYQGRLYRFEYVRDRFKANPVGQACFRLMELETGKTTEPFALGYHLGSAFVDGDTVYVYGVKEWGADAIEVFWSTDLKTWKNQTALRLEGAKIYNTSVCKDGQGYTMAIEFGAPAEWVGSAFTNLFARSKDLIAWELAPKSCVYTKERYSACPALRFYDGYYYMVYLEHYSPKWYFAPHIVRSKDLEHWEDSAFNPLMKPDKADKHIANPKLSDEERKHIAESENINNSDVDFCEYRGKTLIYYAWGNQRGIEFLAEAVYEGPERQFVKAYFPEPPVSGSNTRQSP